jgi:uncharacterized membrane protein HdeD (DUF308 family)
MDEFWWPEERTGLERASSKWWVFLALGIVAVVIGVVLLLDLFAAVATVALLAAVGLVVTGVGELVSAGRYRNRNVLGYVAGGILVVAGVAAAVWPGITLWVLAILAGLALIVSGAARIWGAFTLRVEGWGWLLVGGLASVLIGVLALAWPDVTILALGILLGVRMGVFGIAEIKFALSLHEPLTPAT